MLSIAHMSHVMETRTISRTTELLAFVTAVVSVQRQNNLLALLVWSGIKKSTDNNGQVKLDEVDAGRVQTAVMFTPLRALPDRLSHEQVVAKRVNVN